MASCHRWPVSRSPLWLWVAPTNLSPGADPMDTIAFHHKPFELGAGWASTSSKEAVWHVGCVVLYPDSLVQAILQPECWAASVGGLSWSFSLLLSSVIVLVLSKFLFFFPFTCILTIVQDYSLLHCLLIHFLPLFNLTSETMAMMFLSLLIGNLKRMLMIGFVESSLLLYKAVIMGW